MVTMPIQAFSALDLKASALEGVGYREQELQQARGSSFKSNEANGLPMVSFGGGTHIFIKSHDLHDNALSNIILMKSIQFGTLVKAPPLTQDDAFNSNPDVGSISYRLPDLATLFGMPQTRFDTEEVM